MARSALPDDPRIVRGMEAQLAARRTRLAGGDRPLGWKVGFGSPAALQLLGLKAPLVGYLLQSGRLATGATAPLAGWTKAAAEPEIAITIAHDVEPGGTLEAAATAILSLTPAIELADVDLPFEDPEAILKRNIFQRHVILGTNSRSGSSTAGLVGKVFRDGKETASTADPEALTGKLPDIVRHVADLLAAFGERLSAGDIIIAGSILPPLTLASEERSLRFELSPVGDVSVDFSR